MEEEKVEDVYQFQGTATPPAKAYPRRSTKVKVEASEPTLREVHNSPTSRPNLRFGVAVCLNC